jgi:NAD(P) transhydrogenase
VRAFDLIVIGSGPAGQRAAVQAAKLGKTVALIDRRRELGGVAINTGTIPSKTLREAVLDLSGLRVRSQYAEVHRRRVTSEELLRRTGQVMQRERDVIKDQMLRNGVQLFTGAARFTSPHGISVQDGDEGVELEGGHVVIAVGTVPGLPMDLTVDHRLVLTSDDVLSLSRLPRQMVVVGAGVIGLEYATISPPSASRSPSSTSAIACSTCSTPRSSICSRCARANWASPCGWARRWRASRPPTPAP